MNSHIFPAARLPLFLAVALAVALTVGCAGGPKSTGHIQVAPGYGTGRAYAVGEFQIHWRPGFDGSLAVVHSSEPKRIIWETRPGKVFLEAAIGKEEVTESRGSFSIQDETLKKFNQQEIHKIRRTGNGVEIAGQLLAKEGGIPFRLIFTPISPNRLGFRAEVPKQAANRMRLVYAKNKDERFFGFGEQFSRFDMNGERLPILVMEQGIGRGAQPITWGANLAAGAGGDWHTTYAGVPQYVTSSMRSLFLENYEYSVFDFRARRDVSIEVFSNEIRGQIVYGKTPTDLISAFTEYSGRMRPLPDWITSGAVVGMQGGTKKVREVWTELEKRDTPLAGFWLQDWVGQRKTSFGKQLWWNWELDRDRYPNWDELVRDLNSSDIRILTYVNCFLADVSEKSNAVRNLYAEAAEKGFLVKDRVGGPYLIENTSFSAGLVDLTKPAARDWLKQIIRENVIGSGASGWMADFGEALPWDAQLSSGEAAWRLHNRYPELWAELNREVIEEVGEETGFGDELVFFSRSGFTKSPGASTLFWLGDQLVSWDEHDGMKSGITGMLSGGISGYSLNHSDIGGYTTITNPLKNYHRSQELLLRWMELSAFTSVFRSHEGNDPEANVQVYSNPETLDAFARMAKLYAALAPYRKTVIAEAASIGLPVARHPWIHYPDDQTFWDFTYQQFMLGSQFMVAPVTDKGKKSIKVYLPQGTWEHLWSGERYVVDEEGLWIKVAAPLGEPAAFWLDRGNAEFAASMRAIPNSVR